MIRYALDTNILSELLRPDPHPRVVSRLTHRRLSCAIPAPVVDELQFGISLKASGERRHLHQSWLEGLLHEYPVIPFDAMCSQWHGRERAALVRAGRPPPVFDGLIASIAVVNELVLVTRDTADFLRFPGIQVENWFE